MSNNIRYVARITLEAKTGLFVGSGESSLLKDALVQKDYHGLPMIQGTSLAGVIRHSLAPNEIWNSIFGFQKGDKGSGSRLKISSAYLVLENDKVSEGIEFKISDDVTQHFENLPSRQHVRINDKGVAEKNGLFDNEVVYAGCRFKFEIELIGNEADKDAWNEILTQLHQPNFRLGSGTRNGYGKLAIEKIEAKSFDLTKKVDFEAYLTLDPSFNVELIGFETNFKSKPNSTQTHYKLDLKPDLFFIFSEGSADDKVDNKPLTEEKMVYNSDKTVSFVPHTLVPGSSLKGAIAHRTAFYYNQYLERWAETGKGKFGEENEAVAALFGFKSKDKTGQRGHVMIEDIYFTENVLNNDKIFNHVAIDRFTGGAMEGALFSEKVSQFNDKDSIFEINLSLDKTEFEDEKIIKSLEAALRDICKGLLPLGGMTTKGNGMFTGKLFKNETEIYNYES